MAADGAIVGAGEEEVVAAEPLAEKEAKVLPDAGEEAVATEPLAEEEAKVLPDAGEEAVELNHVVEVRTEEPEAGVAQVATAEWTHLPSVATWAAHPVSKGAGSSQDGAGGGEREEEVAGSPETAEEVPTPSPPTAAAEATPETAVEATVAPTAEPPAADSGVAAGETEPAAQGEAETRDGGPTTDAPEGLEVLGAPVMRLPPGLTAPAEEESRPEETREPPAEEAVAQEVEAATGPEAPVAAEEGTTRVEVEAAAEPEATTTPGEGATFVEVEAVAEPETPAAPEEGATRVEVTLEAEEARQLFALPSVTSTMSGKQVVSARQRIATLAGARIDGEEPMPGEYGPVRLIVESDCPEKTRRALKYIRLVRTANQWWTKIVAADDEGDLTIMEVPEAYHQFVIGRQATSLLSVCEDTGTLVFIVDDSPPAAAIAAQPTPRPPVPWLAVGSRVEVKRGGDIRKHLFSPGSVVEAMHWGTVRVRLDCGNIECSADLSNSRPRFEVGDRVEVRLDGAEWAAGAAVEELREDGHYGVRTAGGELAEVEWRSLRKQEASETPSPMEETPAQEEPPPQTEAPREAAEPMVRMAIFGDLLNRCCAKLSIMRAVDKKCPGYYANAVVSDQGWGAPPGADWGVETLELEQEFLPKFIGTKGAMRRKLAQVAEAALEYLGNTAHICGRRQNRAFVVALLETLRRSERGEVSQVPADAMEHCRELHIPEDAVPYLCGTGRHWLNKLEEDEGVITFLLGPQPEQERVAAEGAEDSSAAAPGKEAEASQPMRAMLIFALSERRRSMAGLRVMACVEGKHSGQFSSGIPAQISEDEPGLSTDVLELTADDVWTLGLPAGAPRSKLQSASGCGVEFVGHLAMFVGVREERVRAREYFQFVLDQKGGNSLPLPKSTEDREDVTVVHIQESDRSYLDTEALAALERASGTVMFFREQPAMEVMLPGARVRLERGGRSFAAKVAEAVDADGTVSLRLVLCEDEEGEEAEQLPHPLLIFSRDPGPSGFTGRALARRLLLEHLAEARRGPPATSSEAPWPPPPPPAPEPSASSQAAEANGAWAQWNEHEAWEKDDSNWHSGRKHAWGGPSGGMEDDSRRGGGRKNARGGGASSAAAGAEDDGGRRRNGWGGGAAAAGGGEAQPAQGRAAGGRQRPGATAPVDGSANPWESWDASKVVMPEEFPRHQDFHRPDHRQDRRQDRRQAPEISASGWENWDASKVVLEDKANDSWNWPDKSGGDWGGGGRSSGWGGGRWGR